MVYQEQNCRNIFKDSNPLQLPFNIRFIFLNHFFIFICHIKLIFLCFFSFIVRTLSCISDVKCDRKLGIYDTITCLAVVYINNFWLCCIWTNFLWIINFELNILTITLDDRVHKYLKISQKSQRSLWTPTLTFHSWQYSCWILNNVFSVIFTWFIDILFGYID